MLIGDNESGKSSVLLALNLVLSGSRHRVESSISRQAVQAYQVSAHRADLLPELIADVFRSDTGNADQNERLNPMQRDEDGMRIHISPSMVRT